MEVVIVLTKEINDWRQSYIEQEISRLTTIRKHYEYKSTDYILTSTDSTFETFNEKHQKTGANNEHFYKYDIDGKLLAEDYCGRTCEKPYKIIYYYDRLNRLTKTKIIVSNKFEWVSERYFYDNNNLLIKKVIGNNSTPTTEIYTYNKTKRITVKTKKEFNTNIKKWLTTIDSMFYDTNNTMILKKRFHIGEDLMTISKYSYKDNLLIVQIDTTITSIKGYLPTPETLFHAYYFREDFKYNADKKIIEQITTRPDYKTPAYKITYQYR